MDIDHKFALVIAGNFFGDDESAAPGAALSLLSAELRKKCEVVEWSCQPSTYYSFSLMMEMTAMLKKLAARGFDGVVVISGSAVMEEMAYLTDLLWQEDIPVIYTNLQCFAGSRAMEDMSMTLKCASLAAVSDEAKSRGVMVCSASELFAASDVVMFDPSSTDNALRSPSGESVGKMLNGRVIFTKTWRRPEFLARTPDGPANVEVVFSTMAGGVSILSHLASDKSLDGAVLAGCGLGSVPPAWLPHIRNLLRRRVPVAIVSRCIMGSVSDIGTYEGSHKKLLEMGVISGGRLNPYQACIRMTLGIAAGLTERGLALYMLNCPVSEDIPELYK